MSALAVILLLVPAALAQQPPMDLRSPGEDIQEHQIQLKPPGPERLFGRLESEGAFQERMRQEARQRPSPERIEFPKENEYLTKERYAARQFPALTEVVEPYFVCHRRLYFEQPNCERYGWDLGFVSPFVCAAKFYWDMAWFPYHIGVDPMRRYECNAGYCLPGDPVPLLLYPPHYSATGAILEAGTIVALFAIFPG